MLTPSYLDQSNDRNSDASCDRNYDGLKQTCDTAMFELMVLRRYIIILMSNLKNNSSRYHTFCFFNTDNMKKYCEDTIRQEKN